MVKNLGNSSTSQTGLLGTAQTTSPTVWFLWDFATLSGSQRVSRINFLLVVLSTMVVGMICLFDAVRMVNEPFPGFLMNERMNPTTIGRPSWTGPQAGVHYPDKFLKANDQTLSSPADLEEVLKHTNVGEPIVYQFEREGRILQARIPTMRFSWTDLALTFCPTFFAGIVYLIIAVVVYILKPDIQVTWALVLTCLLIGIFHLVLFDVSASHRFIRLSMAVNAFIPAAGILLSLSFPVKKRLAERFKVVQVVPFVVSTIFCIACLTLYPGPMFSPTYVLLRIYTLISIATVVISILHAYIKSSSILARQRAKVVLAGVAFAFPIPVLMNHFALMGTTPAELQLVNTFVPIPFLLFPASVAYAIARHNLFDVDVYLKRTVGYVMMTACVASGYFLIQTVVRTALLDPLLGSAADRVYPLLFALLTVFAFNPLSRAVQGVVDKLFYRKEYDYKATVEQVSEALTTLTDVNAFIDRVIQRIRSDLFIDRAGIILLDERSKISQTIFHGGKFGQENADTDMRDPCLSPDDPLLALLSEQRTLITKYDVAEDPRYSRVRTFCGQRFEDLGASLAFPIYYHDQFAGMLALGYKKSGQFYTREEVELLQTITAMTSTAVEHSRERGQKAVLMQLFSKHVSPQVAESLWEQRDHFLEGGRPKSQSMIVTAMFTDLQGFSTISEKQDPEVLMKWLNTYLEMMTTTVMEHGGVVDDFFGDGIKINFGVPVPRTTDEDIAQDARNAVSCALAMEDKMMGLNSMMVGQGFHALRMRIGIHTGSVVAGSLGSADRMKYTTLGDTVNTAARLESFSKELSLPQLETRPCRILIGNSTWQYLGDTFELVSVGDMELKGKAISIPTYCVIGRKHQKTQVGADMIGEAV